MHCMNVYTYMYIMSDIAIHESVSYAILSPSYKPIATLTLIVVGIYAG